MDDYKMIRLMGDGIILGFMVLFIGFEVMWRMMFEMLIGYFQMIEYLQHIAG
jgi:hypothetical protein